MINYIKSKIKLFILSYDILMGVNQGQLRITKKGNIKKSK